MLYSSNILIVQENHGGGSTKSRKVLNYSTGISVWEWDAKDPFGHQLPHENPNGLGVFTFDLRFPGQRFDKETGLFHNNFRDYHPSVRRYMQSDPLGLEAGWNTYSYVGNNPMGGIDPWGLREVIVNIWLDQSGHVDVRETNGSIILNQYPKNRPFGDYTLWSANSTPIKGKTHPDVSYRVFIMNDDAFDAKAEEMKKKRFWSAFPSSKLETNCVDAVTEALNSGGIPVTDFYMPFLFVSHPKGLNASLKVLEKRKRYGVRREKNN